MMKKVSQNLHPITKFSTWILLFAALWISGCSDDEVEPMAVEADFTVTIENVFQGKDYFDNGTTGLIMPGMSESHSFHAGKGHFLQFATMYVQSNDLFYAPSEEGIPLYSADGTALTGDITAMIDLWDAGTEVNEEPGLGDNQAPRQGGADTGMEENGNVSLISDVNDGFNYPADEDIIQIMLEHDGGTMFTLTINNVSQNAELPSPVAPGTWVIHSEGQKPLFETGSPASPGLEKIAEDGDNAMMDSNLSSRSGLVSPFAPGAYSIADANEIFTIDQSSSSALEGLAEDGDVSGYPNVFNTPDNASAPAPIFPGESYSFTFTAEDGDQLSLATMLVQTNDWFIGLDQLALFNNESPVSGDITSSLQLLESGTEVDEYPGAGNFQAPRQSGPNSGPAEGGTIKLVSGSDNVPAISEMIRITITAN